MPSERWIQVNCALFVEAGSGSPFVPWNELSQIIETWRSEHRFDRFFFMRKPPALRLRFHGSDLAANLEPLLVPWLEKAEARNAIRSFRFATYEPELYRFGGPVGMSIAHDQFDRDSRLILRYEALVAQQQVDLTRECLSIGLMQDLFARVVDDPAEVWDIWQRVWHLHGHPDLPSAANIGPTSQESAHSLLVDGQESNVHIAARLHAAEVARHLTCGVRKWLATTCTFHWNRFGLGLEERLSLLASVMNELDPHGPHI